MIFHLRLVKASITSSANAPKSTSGSLVSFQASLFTLYHPTEDESTKSEDRCEIHQVLGMQPVSVHINQLHPSGKHADEVVILFYKAVELVHLVHGAFPFVHGVQFKALLKHAAFNYKSALEHG